MLVKLFAEFAKTKELIALLQQAHDISLAEVEPILEKKGQVNALCILYRQKKDDLKLLNLWAK